MDNSTKERQAIKTFVRKMQRKYCKDQAVSTINFILTEVMDYLKKREKRTRKRKGGV